MNSFLLWLARLFFAIIIVVGPANAEQSFKIYIDFDGVYQLKYQQLVDAGLTDVLTIDKLSLSNQGERVPIWIEDDGDGLFSHGDTIEFVATHLRGKQGYYHDYSPLNVYWLTQEQGHLMTEQSTVGVKSATHLTSLWSVKHFEQDRLFAPLNKSASRAANERWYWDKLSHARPAASVFDIDLPDLDLSDQRKVSLEINLRGWSKPSKDIAVTDHRVEVSLNGISLGLAEWDGQGKYLFELAEVPKSALKQGSNQIALKVPKHIPEGQSDPMIDISYLDWIVVRYPRVGLIGTQSRFTLSEKLAGIALNLRSKHSELIRVYTEKGQRWLVSGGKPFQLLGNKKTESHEHDSPGKNQFWAINSKELFEPYAIELDRPSGLKQSTDPVDYLIISHPAFLKAIEPLAQLHRQQGLGVQTIDVLDVYDEFNDGITDPVAIREFIRYRYLSNPELKPRFVLLVGDASWNTRSPIKFDISDKDPEHRNLIPGWQNFSRDGPAVSDHYYVDLNKQLQGPEMAIGRLPVCSIEELTGIVNKIIAYATENKTGPWKNRTLFISNDTPAFKRRNDQLSASLNKTTWQTKQFVSDSQKPKSIQNDLVQTLDSGYLLAHFYGHGGRYMWQTGRAQLAGTQSFFDMDDIERLKPSVNLPLILSMTCNSAPFDHPNADSLGEKILRLPGQGAIGVLAAGANNRPSKRFTQILIDQLLSEATVGEAVMRTKQQVKDTEPVWLYNLLGDPALKLAKPQLPLMISKSSDDKSLLVSIDKKDFTGHLEVVWQSTDTNEPIIQRFEMPKNRMAITIPVKIEPTMSHAKFYAWNPSSGVDGAGWYSFDGSNQN